MYALAMKYFFIFSLLAFLIVVFYMDIIRYMVASDYWEGLKVVSLVMCAEILKGIYFNLSFWYKLTDETQWGAYFSLIGCGVILCLNIWLVPIYGYVASAWASITGYGCITFLSYIIGQKKYPIVYPLKEMAVYMCIAVVLYWISEEITIRQLIWRLTFRTVLLCLFVAFIVWKDLRLKNIPFLCRRR